MDDMAIRYALIIERKHIDSRNWRYISQKYVVNTFAPIIMTTVELKHLYNWFRASI